MYAHYIQRRLYAWLNIVNAINYVQSTSSEKPTTLVRTLRLGGFCRGSLLFLSRRRICFKRVFFRPPRVTIKRRCQPQTDNYDLLIISCSDV